MNPTACFLLLVPLLVAACDSRPRAKLKPAAPPTPALGPPAQRGHGNDRLQADDAMTFGDLSLLVRTSTPENDIMLQIARRGFLDRIDAAQAQRLGALGASPRLIAVVQDSQYVLSAAERQEFFARKTRRQTAANGKTAADRKQQEAEFAERQRQIELQQQNLDAVAQKQREQAMREEAKVSYEQRRRTLAAEIDSLQQRMNEYRRYGSRESELATMNQRLKALRDELSKLRAP